MAGSETASIGSTLKVTGLFHVGVTIRDMEESLRFYRDGLGFDVVSDGVRPGAAVEPITGVLPVALRSVFLRIPFSETLLELFEYQGIDRQETSLRPCDVGFSHFCLYVEDVVAAHARVIALGCSSIRAPFVVAVGPHTGATAVYVRDPNGYVIELYQAAPEPIQS